MEEYKRKNTCNFAGVCVIIERNERKAKIVHYF